MSATVEIHVSYSGDAIGLAHRIAREFGCLTYRFAGRQFDLTFPVRPWLGIDGTALLIMTTMDRWRHGDDAGADDDDADAPYQYELAVEFRAGDRATLRRFGRKLFDHLSTLDLPLLYSMGEGDVAFADFLPGRGTREFPDVTPMDSSGRVWWYEPRLYAPPLRPWPGDVAPVNDPAAAQVLCIATGTDLGLAARQPGEGRRQWLAPAVSTTLDLAPRDIGLLVERTLRTVGPAPQGADIVRRLASEVRLSIEDFLDRSTTIEVSVAGSELVARAYGAAALGDRPEIGATALVRRIPATATPQALGELVVDLLAMAATP
jgi:hypothetical protein